jgi:predicted Na+-dependent transporter
MAWVIAWLLPDDGSAVGVLQPVGAVLLTLAMFGLGLRLVRSDFLALRVFVGVALPTLVWGVFGVVHQSASDPGLVDAVFGAVSCLLAGLRLTHRGAAPRATL